MRLTTPRAHEPTAGGLEAARAARGMRGLGLLGLAALLAAICLASLFLGSRPIPAADVTAALLDYDPDNTDHSIVATLRTTRMLAGLLVGAALGLGGAVMQGVTRNPLADPGLLGVNAGAAFAIVCAISFLGITSAAGYVWFGFAGAAAVAVLVYAVGSLGRDGATPVKLALAGAAVGAALTSLTTAVLLVDTVAFDQYRFWTVGALTGRRLESLLQLAPFIIAGGVLALSIGRLLNAMALGDDIARGLGQRVERTRAISAVAAVLLCGAATALAGPIWFVGLLAPHLARFLTGPNYRWILPYAMLLAPVLLLGSDIIGRLVARPGELQVGIVMSCIGVPFFIVLVRRRRLLGL